MSDSWVYRGFWLFHATIQVAGFNDFWYRRASFCLSRGIRGYNSLRILFTPSHGFGCRLAANPPPIFCDKVIRHVLRCLHRVMFRRTTVSSYHGTHSFLFLGAPEGSLYSEFFRIILVTVNAFVLIDFNRLTGPCSVDSWCLLFCFSPWSTLGLLYLRHQHEQ